LASDRVEKKRKAKREGTAVGYRAVRNYWT